MRLTRLRHRQLPHFHRGAHGTNLVLIAAETLLRDLYIFYRHYSLKLILVMFWLSVRNWPRERFEAFFTPLKVFSVDALLTYSVKSGKVIC